MSKKIKKALLFIALMAAFWANAQYARAEFVEEPGGAGGTNGGGGGDGVCDEGDLSIDCGGWSWIFYEFNSGATSYVNQEAVYMPHARALGSWSDGLDYVRIPADCSNPDKSNGFWHLGRNANSGTVAGSSELSYALGSTTYSVEWSGYGHRETYHYGILNNNWPEKTSLGALGQEIKANGTTIFTASKYGKREEVETAYYNQKLHNDSPAVSQEDMTSSMLQEARDAMTDNKTMIFCAWDGIVQEQDYGALVKLQFKEENSDLSTGATEIENNGSTTKYTDGQTHKISQPVLYYNAQGMVTVTSVTGNSYDKSQYTVTASPSGNSANFDVIGFYNGPSTVSVLNMAAGVVYEICATNSYSPKYSNGSFSAHSSISACTHVVYEMPCDDSGINQTITSSNQYNYGRIQTTANGSTISAGDINNDTSTSFTDSNSMFSQPTKMSVSYYGCMGGQAAKDGGSGGETKYQILSTPTPQTDQLFNSTKNYIDLTSKAAQSISSTELGLGWPQGADDATVNNRITAKYQFNSSNASTTQLNLTAGRTYKNQLIWYRDTASTDKKTATNEVKVPYNYVLKPIASSSSDILTVGSTYTASGEIKKTGRNNAQTKASEETAPTDIKVGTRSFVALFAVSDGQNASNLQQKLNSFSSHVAETDEYYYNDSSDSPLVRISGLIDNDFTVMEKDGIIENPATGSNALTYTIKSGEKIGAKICSMVAVYPADSHNTHDGNINSNDQNVALTDAFGPNAYWSFKVSCVTVGKSPTTSIEGNSLVTGGGISVSTKTYNGRTFGSWAEYDISSTSIGGPMGSGASMAYDNSQTDKNLVTSLDASGLAGGNFVSPQTLGNTGTLLGTSDSSRILADSKKYVENMIGTFYDEDGKIIAENADKAPELEFRYPEKKDVLIDENIENYSNDTVVVIYGKNVHIAKNVTRIDALIIADGEFDTCSSGIGSDAYEQGAGGTFENQVLLENCGNELVINGAVYAKTIDLDRTYGGGSVTSEDAVNPETLMQRAEVFSYDPRVVKAAYDYLSGLKTLNNTFEKEIAPRY